MLAIHYLMKEWATIRDLFAPINFLLTPVSSSKVLHFHHHVDLYWDQVLDPVLWSQQLHASLQAWGRVAGRLRGEKESGGVSWQGAEHEPAVTASIQDGLTQSIQICSHPGYAQDQTKWEWNHERSTGLRCFSHFQCIYAAMEMQHPLACFASIAVRTASQLVRYRETSLHVCSSTGHGHRAASWQLFTSLDSNGTSCFHWKPTSHPENECKRKKTKPWNPMVLVQVTFTLQYFLIMLMFSVTSQLEHKYRKHSKNWSI